MKKRKLLNKEQQFVENIVPASIKCPKCKSTNTVYHNYVQKRVCVDCRHSWDTLI